MKNSWLRLYAEFATDTKIQMLSEALQRRFIMLLCIRCNGDVTLHDEEVTFQLRISSDEWSETKAVFIAKGFIDSSNNILNWNKRQFRSDASAERVLKHRNKLKQLCNVTVTPPDTDTDTDTESKKENKKRAKKTSNPIISLDELTIDHNAEWLAKKRSEGRYLHHDEHFVLEQFKQFCRAKGTKYADYLHAYRNAFEWEKCQPRTNGYAGKQGTVGPSAWTTAAEQIIAEDRATAAQLARGG